MIHTNSCDMILNMRKDLCSRDGLTVSQAAFAASAKDLLCNEMMQIFIKWYGNNNRKPNIVEKNSFFITINFQQLSDNINDGYLTYCIQDS